MKSLELKSRDLLDDISQLSVIIIKYQRLLIQNGEGIFWLTILEVATQG